ncbi:MAG: hypothetical protein AB1331_10045 [Bacillota bacterium]
MKGKDRLSGWVFLALILAPILYYVLKLLPATYHLSFVATAVYLMVTGAVFSLIRLFTGRRNWLNLAGIGCFVLAGLTTIYWEQLWGGHNFLGLRVLLTEHSIPKLVFGLILTGWVTLLATVGQNKNS